MSKRSHNESACADGFAPGASRDQKRSRTRHEDEKLMHSFTSFVEEIRAERKPDLKAISKSLLHFLPAIRALAEEEEQLPQRPPPGDEAIGTQESQDQTFSNDESTVQKKRPDQFVTDNARGTIELQSLSSLRKWTVDDIPSSLPPLPPVLDPVLEAAAFTHPGRSKRPTDMNYERLEWVGDSYLYVISCGFIYATFPTFSPGRCTQIREQLVRNDTLSRYSLHYRFDERADFPAEFGLGGRPGGTTVTQKERTKVLGDIFEAYVAAVVLSDPAAGLSRASAWLKSLWAGTIQHHIREAETLQRRAGEIPVKVQLANLIVVKGVQLRYEDAPPPNSGKKKTDRNTRMPVYTINLYMDGWGETNKLLGWGKGQSKKEAGEKAAQCALSNKKLMEVYAARKRAHTAAREALRKDE